jgi:hypothetical protein
MMMMMMFFLLNLFISIFFFFLGSLDTSRTVLSSLPNIIQPPPLWPP